MDSPATTSPRPAVCLLSGGLDSATCLAVARREGYQCYALSFDYGQRHRAELQAAARHYRAYLQIVAAHPGEFRDKKSAVLAVYIKIADADAAANHPAEAMQGYNAAIEFAAKVGDKTLESLALAHRAGLQEKQGNAAAAAQSYQRALALDDPFADARGAASDWVNYGQFLRRRHQPERFVFACMIRAEDLLSTTPGDELLAVARVRSESEARLGREASAARRMSEALAKEALSLPASAFTPNH